MKRTESKWLEWINDVVMSIDKTEKKTSKTRCMTILLEDQLEKLLVVIYILCIMTLSFLLLLWLCCWCFYHICYHQRFTQILYTLIENTSNNVKVNFCSCFLTVFCITKNFSSKVASCFCWFYSCNFGT